MGRPHVLDDDLLPCLSGYGNPQGNPALGSRQDPCGGFRPSCHGNSAYETNPPLPLRPCSSPAQALSSRRSYLRGRYV